MIVLTVASSSRWSMPAHSSSGMASWPSGTRPVTLVLGAEGSGVRRLVRERCRHTARLPTAGAVISLNVSNAAAIALYELARGRAQLGSEAAVSSLPAGDEDLIDQALDDLDDFDDLDIEDMELDDGALDDEDGLLELGDEDEGADDAGAPGERQ